MIDFIEECIANNLYLEHILEENDVTLMYADIRSVTEDGVPIRKLFISNLAERTTYKNLTKLFSKYGNVESCFLRRNPERKNYAFVTFDNAEAAVRARREDIRLHNRNLRVEPADSWHQPESMENQYYSRDWQRSDRKQSNEQCNQDYVQSDVCTGTSIQTLNDDCLIHIFLQLPIIDRISIERVCKRWRAVSQESWCSVKRLDLLDSGEINTNILHKVLLRCGRFLTEINLSQVRCPLSQSTLTIIGKLCPNLQRLDVTTLTVSAAGINSLTNNCHDITKFSLGSTTSMCDKDLQKLFQMNQKLRYLKVVTGKIRGTCLLHLPLERMEEVVLQKCTCLRAYCLSKAIEKLCNLKNLVIHKCLGISHNVIQAIGTYCTSLKTLELSDISYLIQSNDMLYIAQLTNLEVLKINTNIVVTDELLSNLALKCQQLTYIDITECDFVTNVGIAAIATLPKLEVLIMNSLCQVTDTNLRDMCNLKRLECRACNFTDKTVMELIASAPRLELLDLSFCGGITNLTLKKAAAVTVNRTNIIILKIFVGGTTVNLRTFDEVSPFLQIVNVLF
ncbi:putative RNA-binding protein EEED8.10 [Andrena cerasifolii]|uniref:putative RNA-binding protein EEED8.10 n=1 Tax=Andrena cerasifolii TaxID=2819439 RepID=UPI00403776FD